MNSLQWNSVIKESTTFKIEKQKRENKHQIPWHLIFQQFLYQRGYRTIMHPCISQPSLINACDFDDTQRLYNTGIQDDTHNNLIQN